MEYVIQWKFHIGMRTGGVQLLQVAPQIKKTTHITIINNLRFSAFFWKG